MLLQNTTLIIIFCLPININYVSLKMYKNVSNHRDKPQHIYLPQHYERSKTITTYIRIETQRIYFILL